MISDLLHPPMTAPASRVAVKPPGDNHTGVDGGWWPRSTDPDTEFPALITALAREGLAVRRVAHNLDAWDHGQRRLTVDGVLVRVEGFHSTPRHIVTVLTGDRSRTRLLVIPPGTDEETARDALRAAGDPASTATAEQILAPE